MKNNHYKILGTAILAIGSSLTAGAEELARWDFSGEPGNQATTAVTDTASGITASPISRGPNNTASNANNSISANNWPTTGDGIDLDNYFEFSITIPAGSPTTLASISFGERRSGSGIRDFELRSNLDGFAAAIGGTPINVPDDTNFRNQTLTLGSEFVDLDDTTVTFRIYGYEAEGAGGTWRLTNGSTDGLVIEGPGGPDLTPPEIASLSPTAGAIEVPVSTSLTATFNEDIQAGTGLIQLVRASDTFVIESFDVTSDVSISGGELTFTPSTDLDFETEYYVTIPNGAVTDLSSNGFAGITATDDWNFTTGEAPPAQPTPLTFSPANGALGVPVTTNELVITFDRDVFPGTGDLRLRQASDDAIVETIDAFDTFTDFDDESILIVPITASLAFGTTYYVEFDAGFVDDDDFIGNLAVTGSGTWAFTTETLPVVPALGPVDPYTEDFASFTAEDGDDGEALLPDGWSVTAEGSTLYRGDWGSGFNQGFRGNASLLGYQHTDSTGVLVKRLQLINDTGAELNDLTVSYEGFAERLSEGRSAAYTVTVNGTEVPALAFSTTAFDQADSTNNVRTVSVSGLAIADGDLITIEWASERSDGSGFTSQIGLSNVVVEAGSALLPPTLSGLSVDLASISQNGGTVTADLVADGGSPITERGFVIAPTDINPAPEIGGTGVTQEIDASTDLGSFDWEISGLDTATSYSVRAYATNAEGTAYSATVEFSTLDSLPFFTGTFEQAFNNFDGTLPSGWTALSSGGVNQFVDDWGSGNSGGFRGNVSTPGVLGYQHTSSSGTLTVTLSLINDTGTTLDELFVSYLGRVERANQSRSPIWTVSVDGTEVAELSYSTEDGVDATVEHLVTGLNIPNGETFTISWESDRGAGGGSSKQIGIADVLIETDAPDPLPSDDFASWIAGFPGVGLLNGFNDDADGNGVPNGLENIFGTDPSNPADTAGLSETTFTPGESIVFQHRLADDVASDVMIRYEWSTDLTNWFNSGDSNDGVSVTFIDQEIDNTPTGYSIIEVTGTITGTPERVFVRLAGEQALPF